MKASIKLRDDDHHPPLLRAKFPITIFNLPLAASLTAGDPSDLSFNILTSFPSLPSLKLSYHPNPSPNPNPSHFSLTLRSGAGPLGSPSNSPLLISFRVSPNPNPTFSVHLKPQLGHFSLTKTAASNPNPNPKETDRLEELVRGGVGVRVTTAVPAGRRAGLKVRWAVKLPPAVRGAGVFGRLPYLSVDKISVERVEVEEEEEEKGEVKELGVKDFEAMKGMCFWMGREVEELKKESGSIKESVEAVRKKFIEAKASYRGSNGGVVVAGRRA